VNIQDAIDVIESVSGFTDESTPVGEAWLEVLSFIHRPAALATPPPEPPTDAKLLNLGMDFLGDCLPCDPDLLLMYARAILERWGR
jgi:hypothetical protein